ncbi:MAG: hypothetical protein ACREIJ_03460 [Nitrospiraceae bacterium]
MDVYPFQEFFLRTVGGRPNQMNMAPYEGALFECACSETHHYSSLTVQVLRELPRARLVFACPNGKHVTCVKLKGIFRFKGFESLFGGVDTDE